MTPPRFVAGPYCEYSRRLKRLHAFIREGRGDSDEADALRDEMDDDYSRPTKGEIDTLELLSADLNWLSGIDPHRDRALTGVDLRQGLMLASADEDWAGLRSLLDSGATLMGEGDGLLFRSIYWLGMGDIPSSLVFFETLGNRLESTSIDIAAKRSLLEGWMDRQGLEDRVIHEKAEDFKGLAGWALQMVGRALEETRRMIAMVKALESRQGDHAPDPGEWSLVKEQFSRVEACTWATPSQAA